MRTKLVKRILLLLLGSLFLFSLYRVGSILYQARKEDEEFQTLASQAEEYRNASAKPQELHAAEEYQSPYLPFKEQNPDFFGWLSIGGTALDYPVMFTPNDPEYYLRRSFDGEDSVSGVPFVGAGWKENSAHTIVYGHNMDNGTMFATLLSYADQSFWEEHPAISFATLEGEYIYQVLGVFYSKAYQSAEENVFRYYQCSDLSTPEAFEEYVSNVKNSALYDTGVEAVYGGQLLTLSTCSYHTQNGRFVVVGYCADAALPQP